MLVLTRKKGESIRIGDHIEVTVLQVDGDQIKIGVTAPKEVSIYRKEIYLDIQNENNEAANVSLEMLKGLSEQMKKNSR